jgi:hypothetical protein
LATYALGFAAIAFQFAALSATARGVSGLARATQARHDGAAEPVLESMRETAHAAIARASDLGLIGFALAVLGGLSLMLSSIKQEPGWRLLAGAVLVGYVLLSLVMV